MKKAFAQAAGGIVAKPKGVICYICGREYGTASVEIHLKSCAKKWQAQEEQKPAHLRRPVPTRPEGWGSDFSKMSAAEIQTLNELSFQNYNTKSLVPCKGCGRTFNPESLEVHMRGCAAAKEHLESEVPKMGKRPNALVCYICGRQYGSHSLKIHLRSCEKQWNIEQEKKPIEQRRPCPAPPQGFSLEIPSNLNNSRKVEEYNEFAFQNFNESALEACQHCGRTFLPDRLIVHLRSCNNRNPANPIKRESRNLLQQPGASSGVRALSSNPASSVLSPGLPPPADKQRDMTSNLSGYPQPDAARAYGGLNLPNTLKPTHSKQNMITQPERNTRSLLTLNAHNILPSRNDEMIPHRPSEQTIEKAPEGNGFKFRFQNTKL